MTCRIRCNMSERVRMWPPKPQRLVFQLKMLGGSLSPDSSLSALEMLIQILPSVEKPASNICENIWITAESASSKCTWFRSRNMGFGMCKTNKQKLTKEPSNGCEIPAQGHFWVKIWEDSVCFYNQPAGKVATVLSGWLKLVQQFLSGDIQPPVLAASRGGIIPHFAPKQSTIWDLHNVMSRKVREYLEIPPKIFDLETTAKIFDFCWDFCCVTPRRI